MENWKLTRAQQHFRWNPAKSKLLVLIGKEIAKSVIIKIAVMINKSGCWKMRQESWFGTLDAMTIQLVLYTLGQWLLHQIRFSASL